MKRSCLTKFQLIGKSVKIALNGKNIGIAVYSCSGRLLRTEQGGDCFRRVLYPTIEFGAEKIAMV